MSGEHSEKRTGTHGRYYAEYVSLTEEEPQHLQELIDEKDGREWYLVGVAEGFPNRGVMLFWDTKSPSFGRRSSF